MRYDGDMLHYVVVISSILQDTSTEYLRVSPGISWLSSEYDLCTTSVSSLEIFVVWPISL